MIKLQDVSAGYESIILSNISFELKQKQASVVLGINGSGKTCLLHTISGVLKCKNGSIHGVHTNLIQRTHDLSYCYQSPLQNSLMTVKDYLDLIEPLNTSQYELLLGLFEIDSLLDRKIAKLSGGEKQRIKLVSTLAQKSTTMILDEPTTALDPYFIDQLVHSINHLKQENRTFLIATHDLSFAIKIADRFLGLMNSSLVFDSTQEELRSLGQLDLLFNRKFEWIDTRNGVALW